MNELLQYKLLDGHIPDDATAIERNGRIFFIHPFKRFDPVTMMVVATAVGTGISVAGKVQEGKTAEKIGKARAAVDIQNAEAVRNASVEKARIKGEQGKTLIEQQKSGAAASGIRINVGSPLVIEADTKSKIATDIGFILEEGRVQESQFRQSAAIEKATGKAAKKQSIWSAVGAGVSGFGSIAGMGADAGINPLGSVFGANTLPAGTAGPTEPGALTSLFGQR